MIWLLIASGLFVFVLGFVRVARIEAEARRQEEHAKARAAVAKAPPPAPLPPMRSYPGDWERPYRHATPVRPRAPQPQPGMSTTDAVLIGLVIGGAFESSSHHHHHHHDSGGYDSNCDYSSWC
jgi:hypothetical protein